jgi:hypothetical protein
VITLATRTRKARRPGTCPLCRGPIQVGQRIALVGYWCHAQCVVDRLHEEDAPDG